jgi:hypothetical protein
VIWTNLNAQSVCTYQIWCFLILWCSTWLEDSRDYKFVIFGHLVQKIWIKQVNRGVWFNLKIISNWILKQWNFMALLESTCSKVSNDILFVIFRCTVWKIWISKDLAKIRFKFSVLIRVWNREGHEALSDLSVPFHADHACGALDLN